MPISYGANLHKWIMCPAAVWISSPEIATSHTLKPAVISWGFPHDSVTADEPVDSGGSRFHFSLEYQGVSDRTPQMVVP